MESLARVDFAQAPFLAIWQTTRDCDLSCEYCPARAFPSSSEELTTAEGLMLLDQLAEMGTPFCLLSGGDPTKREDLSLLVQHGSALGVSMVTVLAAGPRLDRELIRRLRFYGLVQMALNLDGPRENIHDGFRHAGAGFLRTLLSVAHAEEAGLPVQINTFFSGDNVEHFDAMAGLVKLLRPVTWEVSLLVPIGGSRKATPITARSFDEFLTQLAEFSRTVTFDIKVSEAPQYCRHVLVEAADSGISRLDRTLNAKARQDLSCTRTVSLARTRLNAGNGLLFVGSSGEIFPSELLPLACGNVRDDPLQGVYRDHPTFRDLRSTERLKGKCGICKYRDICGGSRARAYAMTGDYLAEEPFCSYEPS